MANTPSFNWETPDDTDLVKDGAAAIRTLGNAIDSSMTDLKGGTTGQVLSKASNTDMDFTWSSVDPLTILDAKGDLISATAADTPARLAVGTNGQYLSANSSTSTGLEWITPPSSGGMTLISETVASALSSLSLSSIPGTYKQLLLLWSGIYHSATGTLFSVRFNNSSGSDYSETFYQGMASAIQTNSNLSSSVSNGYLFGYQQTSTAIQNQVSGYLLVDNYSSTTKHKYYEFSSGFRNVGSAEIWRFTGSGFWEETAAITSLDIVRPTGTATFSNSTNTSIRLYGVS